MIQDTKKTDNQNNLPDTDREGSDTERECFRAKPVAALIVGAAIFASTVGFFGGTFTQMKKNAPLVDYLFTSEELSSLGFGGDVGERVSEDDAIRINNLLVQQFGSKFRLTAAVSGPLGTIVVSVNDPERKKTYIYTVLPDMAHIIPAPPVDMVNKPGQVDRVIAALNLSPVWFEETDSNESNPDSQSNTRLNAFRGQMSESGGSTSAQPGSEIASSAPPPPADFSNISDQNQEALNNSDQMIREFRAKVRKEIEAQLADSNSNEDAELPQEFTQSPNDSAPDAQPDDSVRSQSDAPASGKDVLRSYLGGSNASDDQSSVPLVESGSPVSSSSAPEIPTADINPADSNVVRSATEGAFSFFQGDPDAPVSIHVFVEPSCPYSAQFREWVEPHILAGNISVNWIPLADPENNASIYIATLAAYSDITLDQDTTYKRYHNMVNTLHEYPISFFEEILLESGYAADGDVNINEAAMAFQIEALRRASGIENIERSLGDRTSQIIENNIGRIKDIQSKTTHTNAGTPFIVQIKDNGDVRAQNGASQELVDFIAKEWK